MPTKEPASWVPWILVAIMGAMLYQGKSKPDVPPSPTVEAVVKQMHNDTAKGYAKAFEDAAAKVAAGEIKDEEQLHKLLKENLDDARLNASGELNRLLDSNIPTIIDDGARGAVSTFLQRVGAGFAVR